MVRRTGAYKYFGIPFYVQIAYSIHVQNIAEYPYLVVQTMKWAYKALALPLSVAIRFRALGRHIMVNGHKASCSVLQFYLHSGKRLQALR